MQYKTLAVTGATGFQGGAIVKYFAANHPEVSIQAITRNIKKQPALDLLKLGGNVSLVQADLEDKASLVKAFAGAEAVYLVTDYWNTQNNAVAPNLNSEIMNGVAAIDAAAETKGLKHFLFGTLSEFASQSNMKWRNIYHFNTKIALNAYIRSKPDLWRKSTLVFTPIYFENYLAFEQPFFPLLGGPKLVEGPQWRAFFPENGVGNLPMVQIGDLGKVVAAIFKEPARYFQKYAVMISEYHTAATLVEQWAEAVGVTAGVDQIDLEEFKRRGRELGAPEFMAVEIWEQMCVLHDVGQSFIQKLDIETVDMHGVVKLTTWKDWVEQQDWTTFLSSSKTV
ncbi:NAD(P)-binding protein [Aulographum hederae CBS 113979]|uniref:NAD(P)-binding protein n=1 Tax=Aulographum hederae CBS 113979 TaxID=1176131 RepID=A0A6G1HB34_9PEZI|nr:NAD(P)-binding protein [Aulographum hederae CBS 113979]